MKPHRNMRLISDMMAATREIRRSDAADKHIADVLKKYPALREPSVVSDMSTFTF